MPTILGNVNLEKPFYDTFKEIVHIMLVSFAGNPVDLGYEERSEFSDLMWTKLRHAERELEKLGVDHLDLEERNIMWDEKTRQLMIIDFEDSRDCEPEPRAESPVDRRPEPRPELSLSLNLGGKSSAPASKC